MFSFMVEYLKKYKGAVLLFGLFLVLSTLSSFLIPIILGNFIDSFKSIASLSTEIIYIFSIITIVETISSYLTRYLRNKIANRVTLDMIKDLTSHILKLPIRFFKEHDVMYLSSRVNSDSFNLGDFTLKIMSNAVINLISLVIAFTYIFYIDIGIGLKLIFLIPVYLIIYKLTKNPLFNKALLCKEETNKAIGVMDNQYLNIKVTKINNWYKAFEENLTEYTDKAQNAFEKYCRILFVFDGIDIFIKRMAMLILIIYSGSLVLSGRLTAGKFTVVIAYFNIAFESFTGFIEFAKGYQDAKASYSRVEELLNIKKEANGEKIPTSIDEIKLSNVTFRYDEDRYLLKNFNHIFSKGKIYCIKGKNGIGKSTLIDLILGVNGDYEGEILYNNENITNLNLYSLRTNFISYVEQVPVMIEGSLMKNLTIGLGDYNTNYITNYCEEFEVNNILYNNEDDLINGNNTALSGGEKQKIIICRALGKNGNVIIMDEPDASLDLKAKAKLKEILSKIKNDKIVIIITHDEDFEKIADDLICLS